ncbi:MAG: HEAT repeat domain-containing protein [Spirochaetaceae bacterium]|jgi:HEAT repeat protein|nr:HEAT repeat domain-containing protein [Spirochaetaceae bacterium]
MTRLNAACFAAVLFFMPAFQGAAETASSGTEEASLRETINYGTDNEITELIKKLRSDNIDYLDGDLIKLAEKTKNQNIILGIFSFFGERSVKGLEDTALAIVSDRDSETTQKVIAALDYLGTVKEKRAFPALTEIISSGDARYDSAAVKALGKIVDSEMSSADTDGITEILIDYYNNVTSGGNNREAVIAAVGSSGGDAAAAFILQIINDDEQSVTLRMAALEAAGKLKDSDVLDSIIAAASSADPNVRYAAVGALGSFDNNYASAVILESFRDSYFRTRLAAVRSAKTRRLEAAVPYLRYRAERDESAVVKEEAVLALGAIGGKDADTALAALMDDTKNGDALRSLCAEMLIKNDANAYAEKIIAKLDEASVKKQTALYKGLLKALSFARTRKVENFTARLFASKDVTEKFYALDMTANNGFTAFKDNVEALSKEKNLSLSSRAKRTLEKLGG